VSLDSLRAEESELGGCSRTVDLAKLRIRPIGSGRFSWRDEYDAANLGQI